MYILLKSIVGVLSHANEYKNLQLAGKKFNTNRWMLIYIEHVG